MSKMVLQSKIEQAIPDLEPFKGPMQSPFTIKNLAKFENMQSPFMKGYCISKIILSPRKMLDRRVRMMKGYCMEEDPAWLDPPPCPGMGTVIKSAIALHFKNLAKSRINAGLGAEIPAFAGPDLHLRLAQWAFIVYHVTPNGDSLLVDEEKNLPRRPIGWGQTWTKPFL